MSKEDSDIIDSDEDYFMRARDDLISEVDMRTAFVMTSNVMKNNNRRKKMLA